MQPHPAGLSVDSLELNPASSSSPPPIQDDQWSDTHDTMETDYERDAIEEVDEHPEDLTVQGPKLASSDKTHTHDISTPSPTPLTPATAQERASDAEATSVHSMPVVQVTEPTSPTLPATPHSVSSSHHSSAAPNSSTLAPHAHSQSVQERRRRNRTTLDSRAANRFSGFLSNLIHRRDHPPNPPPEPTPAAPASPANQSSRASSPAPPRPSTPPPQLPPPGLDDLGLTISALTAHLSPAHFSSPPSSGAFLAPHFLLLCHSQGLDVLPLTSPPMVQPYALVRRAPFKSVVVMEHRGVLVAIAGRRDGVRVYALEEIRRMVEWRMDVEIRRERERARREETKRQVTAITFLSHDELEKRGSTDKRPATAIIPSATANDKKPAARRSSVVVPPGPPRPPVVRTQKPKTPTRPPSQPSQAEPAGPPPAYTSSPPRERESSVVPLSRTRSRATSVSEVLAGTVSRRHTMTNINGETDPQDDSKGDWASSDDEAINVMAAPSGSQLLDERTSAMAAASASGPSSSPTAARVDMSRSQTAPSLGPRTANRRSRPANLDLSLTRSNTTSTVIPVPPPSPTPTLLNLRQALSINGNSRDSSNAMSPDADPDADADADAEEEEEGVPTPSSPTTPTRERISLAEALFESRLPDIAPPGAQQPQAPILIDSRSYADGQAAPSSPRTSESHSTHTRRSTGEQSNRRRRRWSVLGGVFSATSGQSQSSIPSLPELSASSSFQPSEVPEMRERRPNVLTRSQSGRIQQSASTATVTPARSPRRPSTSPGPTSANVAQPLVDVPLPPPPPLPAPTSAGTSHSRFLPRIFSHALGRRSDDAPTLPAAGAGSERSSNLAAPPHAPAPKLEYVKLPGTKGAVAVKAVETAKKSFLAILCGDNGEKVELFAGTYRTALGLSRTFILPDSPRSLELQLQGDDLVEVFLVFSQNVFGLEPATVRVREVRIGRAERRAARRRARENASGRNADGDTDGGAANAEEDASVNVTVGIAVTPSAADEPPTPAPGATSPPSESASQVQLDTASTTANSTDELVAVAAAQMSPYTTFQQLSFAPNFPLATIADEYIIPPTYRSFLDYRSQYEPEVNGGTNVDLSQVQFSPPGLPVPTPSPPSKWFYRDPKGVIHGPWKASLMQAWYRDGLLPPDLPVRREEDSEYTLLKDLRLQCVDPSHPFRSSPPPPSITAAPIIPDATKPLLQPQSLLTQPKHFGPPALFFSSRGGHSTTIVDSRGRSVLKGRFVWSADEEDDSQPPGPAGRLGDVKRLEAFDVQDRAVLVAMRQGGIEAVDFGDALLRPADHSRTLLPHFHPPTSSINRRGPFVWKIGTPIETQRSPVSSLPTPPPTAISTASKMAPKKKLSTGPSRSPGRPEFMMSGDGDPEHPREEVIFLGRKGDEMYLCEKSNGSFRILKLAPTEPVS
ncbi:hypothetical protein C8Q79DRAFT_54936 [Trametes meyenii]|nr:hypothetical protein C8Q79DRAFT_54936 [Trametes meyenii]